MFEKVKQVTADKLKKISFNTAKYYANVACPLITYQPVISKEIKKLKKL